MGVCNQLCKINVASHFCEFLKELIPFNNVKIVVPYFQNWLSNFL